MYSTAQQRTVSLGVSRAVFSPTKQTWRYAYIPTRMLAARTSFHHLYLRRYTSRFNHSFQVMAHGQTNWKPPSRLTDEPSLKVYNSLTRTKVRPFRACLTPLNSFSLSSEPAYPAGRKTYQVVQLRAYRVRCLSYGPCKVCSPCAPGTTRQRLSDSRNYVTQDVLRRILSDYFGYDIHFVMNITDIDDKVDIPSGAIFP
jgi:hypothetical protein